MSKIYDYLVEIKDKLETIRNVKTTKIGLEKGIGSKDCPFIRIVPENNSESNTRNKNPSCNSSAIDDLSIKIIFGFDIKTKELEALYDEYYTLEEEIRSKLNTKFTTGHVKFLHTITDEDELPNLKSAISRFEIVGIK